jgi:hypothetical protein
MRYSIGAVVLAIALAFGPAAFAETGWGNASKVPSRIVWKFGGEVSDAMK